MDLRAEEGIFVGYALGYKGYRILNPEMETDKVCNVIYLDEKEKLSNMGKVDIGESTPREKNEAQQTITVHLSTMDNTHDTPAEPKEPEGAAEP
ncbi:UNVERIFIED_CONTAM: hypothetical protein K2H54_048296, partial [Gekko kuhli]